MESLAAFDPLGAGTGQAGGDSRAYLVLDVFTETPLEGNGLGVLTDARGLSADRMQLIARELNLSETIFMLPPQEGGQVRIRIFTPASELPFAGHPVLGAAVVAGTALGLEELRLETGAGEVPVTVLVGPGRAMKGCMEQPVPTWEHFAGETELLSGLGIAHSLLPVEVYTNGPSHVFVFLPSEQAVIALRPDLRALERLGEFGINCMAASGASVKSRMFAPGLGVPEDPATGSAAGPAAVHLARHGRICFGQEIEIRQGAEIGRPSLLYATAEGSPERIDRVQVSGSAVILAAGRMLL
jgi:trans-2,3-dihydro-3-hydroxyanthranilate isomerase